MPDLINRLNRALEGRYRIERELGEGGMATVFLARDLRHDRGVALKVLKAELSAVVGGDRFLAEIRTTANLQHPHILPLFDSGEADGLIFYVMPYVAGESLRDRLDRERQLPVDQAIEITVKVLSALQYAHGQGVVHRDVKPANILLSEGGEPLVADFGIALAVSQAGGGRFTETGLSLGTPHYMSPEQATGDRAIDPRSDIYATGSVLYEMLAGEPPFAAPTAQAVLAKILTDEAPSVTDARRSVPAHVAYAIQRSLERLPADRFTTAAAFSEALRAEGFRGPTPAAAGRGRGATPSPVWMVGWALSLLLLGWILLAPDSSERRLTPPVSFTLEAADGASIRSYDPPQLSPDGSRLLFVAEDSGVSKIQLRRLDELEARWVEGTEGARDPFFSPDGSRIAFFSEAGLRAVDVESGEVETLAGPEGLGTFQQTAVWLESDWIVFTHEDSPDLLGLADGAGPEVLVEPSSVEGAQRFRVQAPVALTATRTLVGVQDTLGVFRPVIVDLEDRAVHPLDAEGMPVGYWRGTLLLLSPDQLLLVELDPDADALGERRVTLSSALHRRVFSRVIQVADLTLRVDPNFIVTMEAGALTDLSLAWFDRSGEFAELDLPRGSWVYPRISPDGARLLVGGMPGAEGERRRDQGVIDLRTGTRTPLVQGGEHDWGPDGDLVYFSEGPRGDDGITRQRADGSTDPEVLVTLPAPPWVTSVSPDGRTLLFYSENIRALDLETLETRIIIDDPGAERNAEFSPDGGYIAYSSNGSGREEVYVKPYPSLEGRVTVSSGGGEMPIWSRDGRELFFISGDRMMASRGIVDGEFQPSRPEELFRGGFLRQPNGDQTYDVVDDGRFLMVRGGSSASVEVMAGWLEAALAEVGEDVGDWVRGR